MGTGFSYCRSHGCRLERQSLVHALSDHAWLPGEASKTSSSVLWMGYSRPIFRAYVASCSRYAPRTTCAIRLALSTPPRNIGQLFPRLASCSTTAEQYGFPDHNAVFTASHLKPTPRDHKTHQSSEFKRRSAQAIGVGESWPKAYCTSFLIAQAVSVGIRAGSWKQRIVALQAKP
eukprot:2141878-Amphidinium_carterae.1